MPEAEYVYQQKIGRYAGLSLLATIMIGLAAAVFLAHGIDVNMTADIAGTAENMLEAEQRLRAKAYLALLLFGLGAIVSVGFYLLLRKAGPLLAGWSLFVSLAAAMLSLMGAVYAMNAAMLAGNPALETLTGEGQRLMLAGAQAMSDYTAFHLGLVLASAANAGFFYVFLKSGLIPKIVAGWGLFASLFVVIAIVARDFIPMFGHTYITGAFMLSNLIALVSTGLYLTIRGVRKT